MEGDFVKINPWLIPFSWIYGAGVNIRNFLFDRKILRSKSFDLPVISVGNITVGGSGKTPHVEYLIRLLQDKYRVAVLSRGYKRRSKGFILADAKHRTEDVGDEPYQLKKKFGQIHVAVDADRCHGIETLRSLSETKDTQVILLDDAYQHRYVKPGINILLVDYHRLIIYDRLLPAGRLREPKESKSRADIVIVTKCPQDMTSMDYRVIKKALDLYPYQMLLFSSIDYGRLQPMYCGGSRTLSSITKKENILLLTGIASPEQLLLDLQPYTKNITHLSFPDHHQFTNDDLETINTTFAEMPSPKTIITTEKDAARLFGMKGLNEQTRHHLYILPIKIKFMQEGEEIFNQKILNYVRENTRNSGLAQEQDDNQPQDSHHSGNGIRTISFRNN